MRNTNHQSAANQEADDDNDSWKIRAFEEDTNNAMGTTWPPRSYTCTFCRMEFKSAQALGGHMNVHRHDRARLHQTPLAGSSNPATSASTLILNRTHQQELAQNGLCLLYSLPNPSSFFSSTTINLVPHKYCSPSINFPVAPPHRINSSLCQSSNMENSASTGNDNNIGEDSMKEELDLELRLGRKSK